MGKGVIHNFPITKDPFLFVLPLNINRYTCLCKSFTFLKSQESSGWVDAGLGEFPIVLTFCVFIV